MVPIGLTLSLHWFVGIDSMGATGIMTEGLCWDLGKRSGMMPFGVEALRLAKAKSYFKAVSDGTGIAARF